jgi:tetratricopeptide (TPR) repeat protein
MLKLVSFILASVFLAKCNDGSGEEDPKLSQPPYDKVTDSIHSTPKDAALYYRRGTALYKDGEMALAEKDLRTAWKLDPKEDYALRLTTILKQVNTDKAVSFLKEALKKYPTSLSLNILLARGYQNKNELDKALAICNAVINQYPGQLDALTLKAEILKQQNKTAESLEVLEEAYLYAPQDVDLVHQLAFEYAEAKNPKALTISDSLIKVDLEKRHAEPYYFKGLYYENKGEYQKAIQYFDEAIQHDFKFLDAYLDKGQTYYEQKKYAEALKTFQLTMTVFPSEALPCYWIGKTQQALGKTDEARANYQRAYGLDKTITEAKDSADRLK